MIAIQSFVPASEKMRGIPHAVAKQARLSCSFLKRHGYKTVMYTSEEMRSGIFRNLGYDEVLALDSEACEIMNRGGFWSYPKLLASYETREPFVHVDTDLFLVEDHIQRFASCPFFTLHSEPWISQFFRMMDRNEVVESFGVDVEKDLSYNCALFGGVNNEDIKSQVEIIIREFEVMSNNADECLGSIWRQDSWKKSVFLEQFVLVNRIREKAGQLSVPTAFDTSGARGFRDVYNALKGNGIIHLWVAKESLDACMGMELVLEMIESHYF